MKHELNDETLTAYALGELDPAETKAIEKLLGDAAHAGNEAPRKTLDEIRAAVKLSEEAFADSAESVALSGEQRSKLESLVTRPRRRVVGRAIALAAALALIASVYQIVDRFESPREKLALFPSYAETAEARAQREWETLKVLKPGVERAFMGDINGPGSSANFRPDFNKPEVQEQIPKLHEETAGTAYARAGVEYERSAAMPAEKVDELEGIGYSDSKKSKPALGDKAQNSPALLSAVAAAPVAVATPDSSTLSREHQAQLQSIGYGRQNEVQVARIDHLAWRDPRQVAPESPGSEAYKQIIDNGFLRVSDQPLSTFSIDVDTASYANVRRFLDSGQLPPPDAVRVEELINYFDYAYPAPTDGTPFAAHFEAAACPWAPAHTLVRIGLKGREVPRAQRPATNLVFLIDVSGSMQPENKLPLVKRAMAMLTRQLDERDRVSIVTYASGVNLALPVTNASRQDVILSAIDQLGAGGSTNGAGGIQLAYQSARENFLPGGVNRVILATDGDFNVGISDNDSLLSMIQNEAKSNVFLSVFGFGMGNLKDDKLEMLADKGNGVYGYIDSESEARKVFVEEFSGTLVTIAKDVKIQVEFNPARVAAYRLIGYENRALAAQDFNDDRKDAGEIGAGHTVTALYEIVPADQAIPAGTEDTLRYQTGGAAPEAAPQAAAPAASPAHADELMLVKLRYKEPEGAESKLLEFPLKDQVSESPSADLKFASAVAAFGKLLRGNPLGSGLSYDTMMQLAQAGLAASDDPRRAEMIHLMLQARPLIEGR